MGSSFTRFYGTEVPKLLQTLDFENKSVLDLGAGDGEILYGLRDRIDHNKTYAVEISAERVFHINAELPWVTGIVGNATKLNWFTDSTIDIVICNQVVEHIKEEDELLNEIYRVLTKNGVCFLSTIFKEGFNFGYYWKKNGERVLDVTHVREYTNASLLIKLKKMFDHVYSHKIPVWFSITDFILPRLGIQGHIYEKNWVLRMLRKVKLPIVGYYTWEFLLWKK